MLKTLTVIFLSYPNYMIEIQILTLLQLYFARSGKVVVHLTLALGLKE